MKSKYSKPSVHYRNGTPMFECKECVHFYKPNKCHLVNGTISPHGVCDLFKGNPMRHKL